MDLSRAEARRIVLRAQGFGRRPARPGLADVRKVASTVQFLRMDPVSVLVRAHHLPAFSRLGPYPMPSIETLAYKRRELCEINAGGVSLAPVEIYPLFRHQMDAYVAWSEYGTLEPDYISHVYAEVAANGPITAGELADPGREHRGGRWWRGSDGKLALEHLLRSGRVTVAHRNGFERVFDITERVIPGEILDAPYPDAEDAYRRLICLSAQAQGIASVRSLTNWFVHPWLIPKEPPPKGKRPRPISQRIIAQLVEDGLLAEVRVEGVREPLFAAPDVRPVKPAPLRALIGPFDSVLWGVLGPLSSFEQHLGQQLYAPEGKRMYGYYVLPFLLGDVLVGRCDLKVDRDANTLVVVGAFGEDPPVEDPAVVASAMADELLDMQAWLKCDAIEVGERGDLAQLLRREL